MSQPNSKRAPAENGAGQAPRAKRSRFDQPAPNGEAAAAAAPAAGPPAATDRAAALERAKAVLQSKAALQSKIAVLKVRPARPRPVPPCASQARP